MKEVNKEEFDRFQADHPSRLDSYVYLIGIEPGDWTEIEARVLLDPSGYRYFIKEL